MNASIQTISLVGAPLPKAAVQMSYFLFSSNVMEKKIDQIPSDAFSNTADNPRLEDHIKISQSMLQMDIWRKKKKATNTTKYRTTN